MQPDFTSAVKKALSEQVAAVGRPVGGGLVVVGFLEECGGAGAAGCFSDEIEAILGETDANREPRIAGGPNRFGDDSVVKGEAGFVRARGIENPQVRAGIT